LSYIRVSMNKSLLISVFCVLILHAICTRSFINLSFVSTEGPVDITAHEVRSDKSLKEIHRATGGPWGGTKVDDAFSNQENCFQLI
jgi:hypothetical protein